MFEAMGYKHVGSGVLVLDGPICPDKVSNISRDCLVAYVECQVCHLICITRVIHHIKSLIFVLKENFCFLWFLKTKIYNLIRNEISEQHLR